MSGYTGETVTLHFGLVPTGEAPARLAGSGTAEFERVFSWSAIDAAVNGSWTVWGEAYDGDRDIHLVMEPREGLWKPQVVALLSFIASTTREDTRLLDYAVISDRMDWSDHLGVVMLDSDNLHVLPKGLFS